MIDSFLLELNSFGLIFISITELHVPIYLALFTTGHLTNAYEPGETNEESISIFQDQIHQ